MDTEYFRTRDVFPFNDEEKALAAARQYLQANLRLGADYTPTPGAFLRARVEVREFRVVNENETFPYVYRNPEPATR